MTNIKNTQAKQIRPIITNPTVLKVFLFLFCSTIFAILMGEKILFDWNIVKRVILKVLKENCL